MTAPMPIPHIDQHYYHHGQPQPQRFPYAPGIDTSCPDFIARGRVTKACENCKSRKVKCNGTCPCERCTGRGLQCIYGERKVRGPTKKRKEIRDTAVEQVASASPTVSFSFLSTLVLFSCWVFRYGRLAATTIARDRADLRRAPYLLHRASPRASPRTRTTTRGSPRPAQGSALASAAAAAPPPPCSWLADITLGHPFTIPPPLLTTYSCSTHHRLRLRASHPAYPSERRTPTFLSGVHSITLFELGPTFVKC